MQANRHSKTQIALEYAYRQSVRDPACSVFWVHADNETIFTQDYKVIAKRLGVASSLEGPKLLEAVRERIEANPCWLLILDNADNLAVFGVGRTQSREDQGQEAAEVQYSLADFVPRGPAGTVLWTSRDSRIGGSLVGARRAINVASMVAEEAKTLLEAVICREISEEESQNAMALLTELEHFPLAVSQAAAYIRRTATPIGEYLSRLRKRTKRWELLSGAEFDRHRRRHISNNVMQTWDISIQHIQQENQMACDIFHTLAFVDNQNIPFELVARAAEILGSPTPPENEEASGSQPTQRQDQGQDQDQNQDQARDEDEDEDQDRNDNDIQAAILLLQHFSFLRLRTSGERFQTYQMHQLVQEATQHSLGQETRRADESRFSGVALRAVASLFPWSQRELWGECERYLEHAQRAAKYAGLCHAEVEAAALLTRVSTYLSERGRWREKEPVAERAYEYQRKALGERHPDTIWSMVALASAYYCQGRYTEAEKAQVELLGLWRDLLGDKHPNTIGTMSALGQIYLAQGRNEEAERTLIDVLAMQRDVLGEKHPDKVRSMAGLAMAYQHQKRYQEAEKMGIEVLALQRELLGEKHPDTIWSMVSLAATYQAQERYLGVEKVYTEVLALRRDIHGEQHPQTIQSMADLAGIYFDQGRLKEAEKLSTAVLALQREVLGDRHPDTLATMHNHANILNARQRNSGSEALAMMRECYRLKCEVLGETHPSTQITLEVLNDWGPTGKSMSRRLGWLSSYVIDHTRKGVVWRREPTNLRKLYLDLVGKWDASLLRYTTS